MKSRQTNRTGHGESARRARGFTLTELMIVVAIASILAAIAYPQYKAYVLRSKRTDARSALTHMAAQEERYYSSSSPPTYATSPAALGYSSPAYSPDGYWTLTMTNTGTPTAAVTVVATAGGSQNHVDDDCNQFTLTTQGVQAATKKDGSDNTSNCWGK